MENNISLVKNLFLRLKKKIAKTKRDEPSIESTNGFSLLLVNHKNYCGSYITSLCASHKETPKKKIFYPTYVRLDKVNTVAL